MKKDRRPKMPTLIMGWAVDLTRRSTCSRLKVGCFVVSEDFKRIYAYGYNGGAKGQNNECLSELPGQCGHVHAEMNALSEAPGNSIPNKVMIVTHIPCVLCATLMVNSGYSKVYFQNDYRDHTGFDILEKAGIELIHLPKRVAKKNDLVLPGQLDIMNIIKLP